MRKRAAAVIFCSMVFTLMAATASAEFKAGAARAVITPPAGGLMYGYGARGTNVSTGMHDPLFAKAVVLDDGQTKLAIVTLDIGSFPLENTQNVQAQVKQQAGFENILCVASHSHSTPKFADDFPNADTPYVRDMEKKIAGAIVEANSHLVPARLGVSFGEAREGHNRRMIKTTGEVEMLWANRERRATSPVDYSVGVIALNNGEGQRMATLVNFACHPVVLGPENLEFSADYVGAFTKKVEEALGGQCMFLQGAAGDINPFWDKTPPAEGAFEQVETMGKAVADAVIAANSKMGEFVATPTLNFLEDIVPLKSRKLEGQEQKDVPATLSTLIIGGQLAFGFFPGEFFVEHGLRFKNESRFPHTFFVGYTNDALHYFPTIRATTEGGYGAATATEVEVGAGERLVNQALINLYYQAGMIKP